MPTPLRNPYIAGKALGDARGFFGREDVFHLVETVLSSPDQNSVVLFGQRRIGKTSILLNLRSRFSSSSFANVYFDLMDCARKSLAQVLYELAATIAQELNLPQPAPSDFDDEGRKFREQFLPTVYAALGEHKRLVLLFDEFDVLDVTQEQLPPRAAASVFFPYLRELMTKEPRLGFVFVVGRKAEELGIEFKATFKASRYQRVSVLDEDAAKELVRLAEREGLLRWADDAVARVLALTARHPYFTQLMCQLLFERAYQAATSSVPTLTAADVDAIVPKALEAAENVFEWIWDGLPPAERVIFSAIASGTDEQTVVTEERLLTILQGQGIRILTRELELAPKTLIEWEMLRQADGGYRFFVELMRCWVVARKSLDKVKDELDRIVPLADSLFQSGSGFFRRGMYEDAITLLQRALNINPNHLKARLLLGEIYRAQGKFDDAVRELEEAYKIDEDSTRIALETALMQRAGVLEIENRTDTALRDYHRVLAISPNNVVAKERCAAIEALQRKVELEKQAAWAEDLARRERWEDAFAAYQRLVGLDGEDKRWQDGLEKVKVEEKIARRYAEGLGAMQQSRWVEAQRLLADVVFLRPDYKDAANLLARAIRYAKEKSPTKARKASVLFFTFLRGMLGLPFLWTLTNAVCWAVAFAISGPFLRVNIASTLTGAAAGALTGTAQWLILRGRIQKEGLWVVFNLVGWGATFTVIPSDAVWSIVKLTGMTGYYGIASTTGWAVFGVLLGAFGGGVSGIGQWLLLRGQVRMAGIWVVASIVGWSVGFGLLGPLPFSLGWMIIGTIIGAVGGSITGLVLAGLFRNRVYPQAY